MANKTRHKTQPVPPPKENKNVLTISTTFIGTSGHQQFTPTKIHHHKNMNRLNTRQKQQQHAIKSHEH